MKKSTVKYIVRISEVFDTLSDAKSGKGFWGFIITYPRGRIENRVLEYQKDSYEYVHQQIIALHKKLLSHYHIRIGEGKGKPG